LTRYSPVTSEATDLAQNSSRNPIRKRLEELKGLSKRQRSVLVSDPLPFYGFLSAAVVWVVFILRYYRTYESRIEKSLGLLQQSGEQKLRRLMNYIEGQVKRGNAVDPKRLDSHFSDVRSLLDPQSVLSPYVPRIVFSMVIAAIASIGASFLPDFQVWMTDQGPVTLTHVAAILLVFVFIVSSWFLVKIRWFVNEISKAEKPDQPQAIVETRETQHLRRLRRLGEDFHDLTMGTRPQAEDFRILRILDFVPRHSREDVRGAAIGHQDVHLYKRCIHNAHDLLSGWFDEHQRRVDFFLQSPVLLDRKNLADLVNGFRRLVFEYHGRVVDESIDFVNEAGVEEKDARIKFNEFKDRYNQFAERLRSFLKDLKDDGYDIGTGWEVRSVSKELQVKSPA